MKKLINSLFTIVCLFIFANAISAADIKPEKTINARTQVVIDYTVKDWQSYEFWAEGNDSVDPSWSYEWLVDNQSVARVPRLHYFFSQGKHNVTVVMRDTNGGEKTDTVSLNINFWSWGNNKYLWIVYGMLIFSILYYWIIKLLYFYFRKRTHRQAGKFLETLDKEGFHHKVIQHIKNKK